MPHRIPRLRLLTYTAMLLAILPLAAEARPLVVASIKPLSLLVEAVSDGQVDVETLLPPGSSPHTYQMRPSDRGRLSSADLVIWVGPRMETFLSRVLTSPELKARTLSLAGALGLHSNAAHGQGHDHSAADFDRELDPHIWLDPRLVPDMAAALERRIAILPGIDAGRVHRATARFLRQQATALKTIRTRLAPLRQVSLFAYHDAFRRYADGLDLQVAGILTLNPQRAPGARHLSDVAQALHAASRPCLVTEPEFSARWWRTLAATSPGARQVIWDPLAAEVPAGPDGFIRFEQTMAAAIARCQPGQ